MGSERVEVIIFCGGPLGEDGRVAGSDQPTSLTLERSEYKRGTALDVPLLHFPVNEVDDFLRKPNGDLLAHSAMVPIWDAKRYR